MISDVRTEVVRRLTNYDDDGALGTIVATIPKRAPAAPYTFIELFGTRDDESGGWHDEEYALRVVTVAEEVALQQTDEHIEELDPLIEHQLMALPGVLNGISILRDTEFAADEERLTDVVHAAVGPNAGSLVVAASSFKIVESPS